ENEDRPEEEKQKAIYRRAFSLVVKKDPVRWGALVLAKVRWFWIYPAVKEDVVTWWGSVPPPAHLQTWLVLFALVGLTASLRKGPAAWIPAALAIYLCAVHAATHLVSRYGILSIALAMSYASFGFLVVVRELVGWFRRARGATSSAASGNAASATSGGAARGKGGAASRRMARGASRARRERGAGRTMIATVATAAILGLLALLLQRDLFVTHGTPVRMACWLVTGLHVVAMLAWGVPLWLGLRTRGWTR